MTVNSMNDLPSRLTPLAVSKEFTETHKPRKTTKQNKACAIFVSMLLFQKMEKLIPSVSNRELEMS